MGFRINTNVAAMNAQTTATATNRNLSSSLEKLSSGFSKILISFVNLSTFSFPLPSLVSSSKSTISIDPIPDVPRARAKEQPSPPEPIIAIFLLSRSV